MSISIAAFAKTPYQVRAWLLQLETDYHITLARAVANGQLSNITITSGMRGLITNLLTRYAGDTDNRHAVIGWVLSYDKPISSKILNNGEWYALWQWLSPAKEEGQWVTRPEFPLECAMVLTEAIHVFQGVAMSTAQAMSNLATAVNNLGGVITAVLRDDGVPDVNEDIEVRAILEDTGYQPIPFLERMKAAGYYKPKEEEGGKSE